jgi:hypothetical protein
MGMEEHPAQIILETICINLLSEMQLFQQTPKQQSGMDVELQRAIS